MERDRRPQSTRKEAQQHNVSDVLTLPPVEQDVVSPLDTMSEEQRQALEDRLTVTFYERGGSPQPFEPEALLKPATDPVKAVGRGDAPGTYLKATE